MTRVNGTTIASMASHQQRPQGGRVREMRQLRTIPSRAATDGPRRPRARCTARRDRCRHRRLTTRRPGSTRARSTASTPWSCRNRPERPRSRRVRSDRSIRSNTARRRTMPTSAAIGRSFDSRTLVAGSSGGTGFEPTFLERCLRAAPALWSTDGMSYQTFQRCIDVRTRRGGGAVDRARTTRCADNSGPAGSPYAHDPNSLVPPLWSGHTPSWFNFEVVGRARPCLG